MIEIINKNLESNAYDGEKLIGRCQYRIDGDKWVIYHTDIDKDYGGRGIALSLVESIISSAREEGKRIVSECSYVRHIFEKDREKYKDIIAD